MPRFQLLVREPGKPPRVVPLSQPVVVGRSRRCDVVLEDEEVGREQFRIGFAAALVVIEGIGQTNRTVVDGRTVDAGDRVSVGAGATIKVGRSIVQVQAADTTESAPARPGSPDVTMVTRGPTTPAADAAAVPQGAEETSGYRGPQRTMPLPRPGVPPPGNAGAPPPPAPGGDAEGFGQTLELKGGFRPGTPGAGPPGPGTPPPAAPGPGSPARPAAPHPSGGEDFGQTIDVKGAFRPGAPAPGAAASPASGEDFGQTIDVKGAFRPGAPPPAPPGGPPTTASALRPGAAPAEDFGQTIDVKGAFRPGAPPPAAPTPAPAAPPPAARPPAAATPAPPPTPTPAGTTRERPKTVRVDAGQLPPVAAAAPAAQGAAAADVESLLHQAMPRLVVKGEGIQRRVRLIKAKSRIGRAETADVLLPNESVSEAHAEIEFDGTAWTVRDCGSTNGTLIDGTLLRGGSRTIARNTLLGFGNLRGLFVCNDPAARADERRIEERALRLLVAAGRLPRDVAKQALALVRRDDNQSLGEILLLETAIEPLDWANAIGASRQAGGMMTWLRRLFGRKAPPPPVR